MDTDFDLTYCPEEGCGVLAEIMSREILKSTDGAVEHVKLDCAAGHRLFMPTYMLARAT